MKYTTWAIFVAFALAAFCTGASARSSVEDAADSGDDDWCESQAYCESSRAHYNKINHCQYLLYSCLYTVGNDTDDVEGRKRSTEDETDGLTYTCGCTPDESTSEGERRRRRSTEDTTGDVTWTDCSCLCACFNMYFNCYYQICDNMTWAVRSIPSDLVSDYSDTDCTTNTDTSTNNKTATSDSNGGVVVDSDSTPGGTGSTPGGADSTSGGTGGGDSTPGGGDSTPGGGDSTTGGDSNSGLFPVASDSTNGGDSTTGGGSSPGGDSTTTGGSNSGAFPVASDSTNGGSTTGGGSSPGGDSTTGGSTGGGAGSSGAGGNTAVSSSIVSPNNYYSSSGTSTTTKNTTRCYFQMYGDPHMVRFAEVSRANDQWLCMSDTTYPKLYHSDSLQVSAHATIPFVGSSVSYLRSVSFTISGTTYTVNTTNFAITPSKAPSGHYFGTCNSSVTTPLGSFSYPCVAMYAPTGDWVAVFYIADTGVGNYLDLEIYGDCETTSVSSLQSVECPGSKKRSIDEALRSVVVTAEAEAACATVTGNYKSACKYDYAMTGGLVSSSSAAVANSGMVRVASLYAAYVAVQQNTTSSSSSSKISQGAAAGIAIGTGVAGIIIGAAIIGGVAIKRKRNN